MGFLGKIVAAPIRLINIPVKVGEACFNALSSEPVKFEWNELDKIAEVAEKSVDKIFEGDK